MPIANPILHDFPEEFHSPRLLIRGPRAGDGRLLNAAIAESHSQLIPWMPWADPLPTPEQSEENVREAVAEFILRRNLRMHMFLKDTGEFVGSSGLHNLLWQAGAFEIGYWIRTPMAGQGLMTEAVRAIVQFAGQHLDARRLQICCDARNGRSQRVAERAGFHLEAVMRRADISRDGSPRDTLVYALLRSDNSVWGYPQAP